MTDAPALTQKQIARALDRAAARSAYPASPKQTWFLAGLILKNETPEAAEREYDHWLLGSHLSLSGREASSMISEYLNQKAA